MRTEELPGIAALFIPNSPSSDLGLARKFMRALVAGARNVPNLAFSIPFNLRLLHTAA
jgi:hypothetical protein